LLDAQGEPHVSDFGLAKCLDTADGLDLSGAMLGSPCYMSPEQAAGQSERLTTASDTYSLGALLYQLLTGRPPFEAATPLATMKACHGGGAEKTERAQRSGRSRSGNDLPQVPRERSTAPLRLGRCPGGGARALASARTDSEPGPARPPNAWANGSDVIPKWLRFWYCSISFFIIGLGGILIVSVRLVSANRAKEQVNAQLAKNVRDFEWQKIDELIATGKRADALAYLSAFLRRDPNDRAAANRLVSMLSGCKLCAAHDYTAAARDRSKLARAQQRRPARPDRKR